MIRLHRIHQVMCWNWQPNVKVVLFPTEWTKKQAKKHWPLKRRTTNEKWPIVRHHHIWVEWRWSVIHIVCKCLFTASHHHFRWIRRTTFIYLVPLFVCLFVSFFTSKAKQCILLRFCYYRYYCKFSCECGRTPFRFLRWTFYFWLDFSCMIRSVYFYHLFSLYIFRFIFRWEPLSEKWAKIFPAWNSVEEKTSQLNEFVKNSTNSNSWIRFKCIQTISGRIEWIDLRNEFD